MNVQLLLMRTALMRSTDRVQGTKDCRSASTPEVEVEGRTTKVRELGFRLSDGDWAADPDALVEVCGTPGCVMHLVLGDSDAADLHLVARAARRPSRDVRALFRRGVAMGWFKSGGYQN